MIPTIDTHGYSWEATRKDPVLRQKQVNCSKVIGIIKTICRRYGVPPMKLKTKARRGAIPECRASISYVLRNTFDMTYNRIGEMMKQDHSTIMEQVSKIAGYIDSYPAEYKYLDDF